MKAISNLYDSMRNSFLTQNADAELPGLEVTMKPGEAPWKKHMMQREERGQHSDARPYRRSVLDYIDVRSAELRSDELVITMNDPVIRLVSSETPLEVPAGILEQAGAEGVRYVHPGQYHPDGRVLVLPLEPEG